MPVLAAHSDFLGGSVKVGINVTHGLSGSPVYLTWQNMKNRCSKPEHRDYPDYGGRGIRVCKRWQRFENFYADMGNRPKDRTLDRIDNDGNYAPNNCQWSSPKEQARNKRNNRNITWKGETLCLMGWAERTGLHHSAILARLDCYGWSVEDALTKASSRRLRKPNRILTINGESMTISDWGRRLGMKSKGTINERLKAGWSVKEALTEPKYRRNS